MNWRKLGYILFIFLLLFVIATKQLYACSAAFTVDDSNPVVNSSVTFTSTNSDRATSINWNFGANASPSTSGLQSLGVTYSQPGVKDVSLKVDWWLLVNQTNTQTGTVTVHPLPPTGTTPQTFCASNSPTVASLTATGTAIKWYSVATGGTALLTSTSLSTGNYYASQTVNSVESLTRLAVVVTIYPTFTSGTIESTGQTICYSGTASQIGNTTIASGGDNTITYSWRSSADGYTAAIGGATASTYTPPAGLTATTSYRRYSKDGTCNTTPTVSTGTWTVTVRPNFTSGAIESTGQTICYSGTPTLIGNTTVASGGDNTITYSWRSSADGYTAAIGGATASTFTPPAGLTATTSYHRYANDATCNTTPTVSSGTWTVTVYNNFTSGTIASTGQTICYGGTPSQIGSTTDASGGDGTITYSWRSSADGYAAAIGGATASTFTPPAGLTTTTSYRRYANDATCNTTPTVSSGTWTVTVYNNFTSGTITSTGQTICYGGTPSQIGSTADASGGDNTITYSWRSSADNYTAAIGGATASTFTPPAGLTTTTSYRRYANDATCNTTSTVSSGTWTVTVYNNFTSGTIASTGQTICYGGTPSQIGSTTDASGGDGTTTYSWRSSADGYAAAIGGATASTFTPPAGLTTTTSYRRYANDATCNTTPTLSTGTWMVTVYADFTSGEIASTGETICYGGTPSQIGSTTDASGGDGTITYSWRSSADGYAAVIGGATASTFTPPAGLTTTTSYRRYANDATCNTTPTVSSGTWTVTVYNNFTSGTIASTGQTICYGGTPSQIGSTTDASGGDGTITYSWRSSADGYAAAIGGATASTFTPPAGLTTTTSYRRYANDATCNTTPTVSSGTWTVTVYNNFTSGTIASTGQTICYGGTPSQIGSTTDASGGDGTITYSWRSSADGYAAVIGGATASTFTPPAGLTTTTSYRRYANDGTCNTTPTVSTGTWTVTVYNNFTSGTIASTGQTICYGGTPSQIGSTTVASGGDGTITYSWRSSADGYTSPIGGAASSTYTPPVGLTATTGYQRYANDGTCNTTPTVSSGTWTVTVRANFTSGTIASTGQTICYNSVPSTTIGSSTAASGGDNTITYQWQYSTDNTFATGVTTLASNTATYKPTQTLTQTTHYRRQAKDGTCNTTFTSSSNIWTVTVSPLPSAPTTTNGQICIGSTATLSASGAVAGERYLWYSAAIGGSLLKTSTNNSDNTYTTPTIGTTTNYWVSIVSALGCQSSRTQVTATFPANSPDSQTSTGTDSWVGHVYDGTNAGVAYSGNFINYYGNYTELETFDQQFGGNTNCFTISSSLGSRQIYTETYSVRYRNSSTKKGLYIVDLGSDDGSRLSVDGILICNNWGDQSWSLRPRILMTLTGTSSLVYDFYENGGGNRVTFQNLTLVLANTLSTNVTQSICIGSLGSAISGDTYGTLPGGISLSGTGYQWTYSTTPSGIRTNISGATGATFTPNTSNAPFNTAGTYYVFRNAMLSSANNLNPNPYVATNESNEAIITVIALPVITAQPSGDPVCEGSSTSISVVATGDVLSYQWQYKNGAAWSPVPSISGISGINSSILVANPVPYLINGYNIRCVVTSNGCSIESDPVTINVKRFNLVVSESNQTYCPDLSGSTEPPFEPNNTNYNAGATIVEITIKPQPGSSYSNNWSFDFVISGTVQSTPSANSVFTKLTISDNATLTPSNAITSGNIKAGSSSSVVLQFHVKNTPASQQKIDFNISNISNGDSVNPCGETTTNSGNDNASEHIILPMPAVGNFN